MLTLGPPASGTIGVYAMIERVEFEPSESAAARVRVYGAFMYVNGGVNQPTATSRAGRGYMYFALPPAGTDTAATTRVRREWADMKAVAGTGQAIGFGNWFYFGQFESFSPSGTNGPQVLAQGGNDATMMRVRLASETPSAPMPYVTNVGLVKLTEASHAAVIRQLREALR
jgi:hypothetical protein